MSLIKTRKSKGPRTDPCGTPPDNSQYSRDSSVDSNRLLPVFEVANQQLQTCFSDFFNSSILMKRWCKNSIRFVSVDFFERNAFCDSDKNGKTKGI